MVLLPFAEKLSVMQELPSALTGVVDRRTSKENEKGHSELAGLLMLTHTHTTPTSSGTI